MNGLLNASTDTMSAFLSPKLPTENGDVSASQTTPEFLANSEDGDLATPKFAIPKDAFVNLLDGITPANLEKAPILPNQEASADQPLIIQPSEKNTLIYAEAHPINLLEATPKHDATSITKTDVPQEIAIKVQPANDGLSLLPVSKTETIAPNTKEAALPTFIKGDIKASFIDTGTKVKLDAEYEQELGQNFITNRRASALPPTTGDIPTLAQTDTIASLPPVNNIELAQQDVTKQASYIAEPRSIDLPTRIDTKQGIINHDNITTQETLIKAPVVRAGIKPSSDVSVPQVVRAGIKPTNNISAQEVIRAGIKPAGDINTQKPIRAGIKPTSDISAQEVIRAGIKPAGDINTPRPTRAGIKPVGTQALASDDSVLVANTLPKEMLTSAQISSIAQTDNQEGDAQKVLQNYSKQTALPIFEHANANSQDGQQQNSAHHTTKQAQSQTTQFTPTQSSEASNLILNASTEAPQIALDSKAIEIASTTSSSVTAAAKSSAPAIVSHMAVQQVGEAIVRQSEKSGDIVIRLDPAELGKVNITFTFDKAGGVNAHVVADTASTAAVLRDRADILATQLKQSGFENINLSFDTASSEQNNKGFGTQFSNNAQSEHNTNRAKFFDIVEQDAQNPLLQAEKTQHRPTVEDGALDLKL